MTIEEFFQYWEAVGWAKVFRVFWYFFLFEFTRYVLTDFIALFFYGVRKKFRKEEWDAARNQLKKENPLVSVIVPGKNEGKNIYKLTRSLASQTYRNFELIIVDDGSDDDTRLICKDLLKAGLIDLFLSNSVRGGKASGANLALRYAKGKYILHFDADCSFAEDAIENALVPFYYDPKIGAVGGTLEVRNHKQSLATSLQAIEYLKTILVGRTVSSFFGIYRIVSGAFGAFRKDLLDHIKGWDIGPGLDGDITVKIRKLGYKIHFEPTAVGYTSVPKNFKKLARQRIRWDKSIIRFRLRKHFDVFIPNKAFRTMNFLSSAENLFYNVILNFNWYIYFIDLLVNFNSELQFILPMNYIFYTLANLVQMIVVMTLTRDRKTKLRLFLFLPLMVLYTGFFLRIVRTVAHINELLFKTSYDDPWNPKKTSIQAKKLKI